MILFRLRHTIRRHRERHATRHAFLTLVLVFIALTISGATMVARIEKIGIGDALWQVWQTVTTVGYGDGPAKSLAGRLITAAYGTLGIVVLGQVFTMAIEHNQALREQTREGRRPSRQDEATLIVGFPGELRTLRLIEELRSVNHDLQVCLVDSSLEELPSMVRELPGVHFVRGPLTLAETYLQAGIERAKAALVIPNSALQSDADAQTYVQIQLLKRLNPQIRVVYILADLRNEVLFEGVDASPVASDIVFQALVQEVSDPGVSESIESMLSNVRGANPKTVSGAPLVGWTWGQVCGALHQFNLTSGRAPIMPHALVRGRVSLVAVSYAETVSASDHLILTSTEDFDWAAVSSGLKR